VVSEAKDANWDEVDTYIAELTGWLRDTTQVAPTHPMEVACSLPSADVHFDDALRARVDAARVQLVGMCDFRARKTRQEIRSAEDVVPHILPISSEPDAPPRAPQEVLERATKVLPFYDSSDIEALRTALDEGKLWLARMSRQIDHFEEREGQRADAVPALGIRWNGEARIAQMRIFSLLTRHEIERLIALLAGNNAAGIHPTTVRGQNAFLETVREELRRCGFKPADLPKLLRQRSY
jgi:hypothetical protein